MVTVKMSLLRPDMSHLWSNVKEAPTIEEAVQKIADEHRITIDGPTQRQAVQMLKEHGHHTVDIHPMNTRFYTGPDFIITFVIISR